MKKKYIDFLKVKNFLENYPIILFLQHNNLNIKNWSQLRQSLNITQTNNVLLFKNRVMETALSNEFLENSHINSNKVKFIFQGPSFAIGCTTLNELQKVWDLIDSTPNVVTIGGLYSKQLLTHLDIKKLLKLQDNTHAFLLNVFYNCLSHSINLSVFEQTQYNLVTYLSILKQKLKNN